MKQTLITTSMFLFFFTALASPVEDAEVYISGSGDLVMEGNIDSSAAMAGVGIKVDIVDLNILVQYKNNGVSEIVGKEETDFTDSILTPGNTGTNFLISGEYTVIKKIHPYDMGSLSPYLGCGFGLSQWTFQDEVEGETVSETHDVTLVSIDSGIKYTFLELPLGSNNQDLVMSVKAGPICRIIQGEASQNKDYLDTVFDSKETFYGGFSAGFVIEINQFSMNAGLRHLFSDNEVTGLTGNTYYLSGSVNADFVQVK